MTIDQSDRTTLIGSVAPHGIGAEVGVAWGRFADVILDAARPRRLYLIDCWEQQDGVYGNDAANEQHDEKYMACLGRFITDDRVRIVKAYSEQAASLFQPHYFDWVYLDANHAEVHKDIVAWWPKITYGGILMGHDYCDLTNEAFRVKSHVDAFSRVIGAPLIVTQESDEKIRSWAIIKHYLLPDQIGLAA